MTTTLLLQLSDPHIREPGRLAYGRINTAPYLAEAVASVHNEAPYPIQDVLQLYL